MNLRDHLMDIDTHSLFLAIGGVTNEYKKTEEREEIEVKIKALADNYPGLMTLIKVTKATYVELGMNEDQAEKNAMAQLAGFLILKDYAEIMAVQQLKLSEPENPAI